MRLFIAVDGIDGAGKTTLVRHLATRIADLHPITTKEPTDKSDWGKALRDSAVRGRMPRAREIEYFHKDRMHHLETHIKPALAKGRPVICDRYVDSTLAFQGRSPADADKLYSRFLGDILVPDLTLILDCPVETGMSRIRKARARLSTFEDLATLERARLIYETRQGPHYAHIDASGAFDETWRQACAALKKKFRQLRPYLTECSSPAGIDRDLKMATA